VNNNPVNYVDPWGESGALAGTVTFLGSSPDPVTKIVLGVIFVLLAGALLYEYLSEENTDCPDDKNKDNVENSDESDKSGERNIGEKVRDIDESPQDWEKIDEKLDPKQPKRGKSIRELWRNKKTGEKIPIHRKTPDPKGQHPHYDPKTKW